MWHRLALCLGGTVRELKERMDAREFLSWLAYHELEPFGPERAWLGPAIVAQTFANIHRTKGARPFELKHFYPDFRPKKKFMPIDTVRSAFKAMYGKRKK